ncbi:MAG: hypothetical protein GY737_17895 [Desulfobacteraceae bacterium]|nr:hypothetical protein [Desulfobacteraceae bacterium]
MRTKLICKTAALIFRAFIVYVCIENSCFAADKVNLTIDIEKFVMETFNLELQGVRWAELTGRAGEKKFYARFLWSKDFESGWDLLYITDSVTIESITFSEKIEFEVIKNDKVVTQISPGYIVSVVFHNLYSFTRRSYERTMSEDKIFKVILTDSGPQFVDRLHPPHLGYKAALEILNSKLWNVKDFCDLKKCFQIISEK